MCDFVIACGICLSKWTRFTRVSHRSCAPKSVSANMSSAGPKPFCQNCDSSPATAVNLDLRHSTCAHHSTVRGQNFSLASLCYHDGTSLKPVSRWWSDGSATIISSAKRLLRWITVSNSLVSSPFHFRNTTKSFMILDRALRHNTVRLEPRLLQDFLQQQQQ